MTNTHTSFGTNSAVILGMILLNEFANLVISDFEPNSLLLKLGVFLTPVLLGVVGALAIRSSLPTKLALLALLPVVHFVISSSDLAKPFLNTLSAFVDLVLITVGCCATSLILWIRGRQKVGP